MIKALLNVFLLKEKRWIFFTALLIAQFVAIGDMENAMSSLSYDSNRLVTIIFIAELPVLINFPLLMLCGLVITRFYDLFANPRSSIITFFTLFIALMAESSLPVRFIHSLGLFQYLIWLTFISLVMLYLTKGDKPAFDSAIPPLNVAKEISTPNPTNEIIPRAESHGGSKPLFIILSIIIGLLLLIYLGKKWDEYKQETEDSADSFATTEVTPNVDMQKPSIDRVNMPPNSVENTVNTFPTKTETDAMVAQRLKDLDAARLQSNDVAAAAIARSDQMANIVVPAQSGRKLGEKYCLNNVMRIVTKDDPAALVALPDGSYESCAE